LNRRKASGDIGNRPALLIWRAQSLSGPDGIKGSGFCFDALSSREPVSTSLENAIDAAN
jgi:hypothetical protein